MDDICHGKGNTQFYTNKNMAAVGIIHNKGIVLFEFILNHRSPHIMEKITADKKDYVNVNLIEKYPHNNVNTKKIKHFPLLKIFYR